MCGIVGGVDRLGDQLRRASVELLKHRGPNHQDLKVLDSISDRKVWFGHSRLAVLDTRAVANQPMFSQDRRFCLIFNGEIYNYRQLANDYLRGYSFLTTGDTEVLLALWEKFGQKSLNLIRGIFAFAIYDFELKKVILARDHIGVKPLYYAIRKNGDFSFSSDASLIDAQVSEDEVNSNFIASYLWYRYLPGEKSFFPGVDRLPAGSILERDSEGIIRIIRYWSPVVKEEKFSLLEASETLGHILKNVVSEQLIADVQVGIFLSGGLDSSLITAYANSNQSSPINTFSIQFDEKRFDESQFAADLSREFKIKHHSILFSGGVSEWLPKVAKFVDEPLADPALLPFYALSSQARSVVTVALSGDGADELFGGYKEYRVDPLVKWLRLLPCSLLPYLFPHISRSNLIRLERVVRTRDRDHWPEWTGVGSFELAGELAGCLPLFRPAENPTRQQRLTHDLESSLQHRMLMKVDKMSMAHGLEVRVPYLDLQVVNFALSIPINLKVGVLSDKRVLRKTAAHVLPVGVSRRRKRGFNVPIATWLQTIDRDYCNDTINCDASILNGVIDQRSISRIILEHEEGKYDHSTIIFALLVLAEWKKARQERRNILKSWQ